jgi:MFS family permease
LTAPGRHWPLVMRLGTAQTLSWASSYYLCAIVAAPMAQSLGLHVTEVFAAFSAALVVSAVVGPAAGQWIDRHGGRGLLMASHVIFALALWVLSQAPGRGVLWLGWLLLGLGMGTGLYEAAFASLVRLLGPAARNPITGITLLAGFASTVGWPLSAWMVNQWGWREACIGWAVLHVLLGLPLSALVPRAHRSAGQPPSPDTTTTAAKPNTDRVSSAVTGAGTASSKSAWLLAWVFAATWYTSTAMATHFPQLLMGAGVGLAAAVAAGALIGPAQVAGRLLEFGLLRRLHPLWSARAAALAHPLGALAFAAVGAPAASALAVLHGTGNGILTIAKGTLPLVLFGPGGYGHRQGWIMAPSRLAQAAAPLSFGWCMTQWGTGALWLTSALAASAVLALLCIRAQSSQE